jgi:rhodanese-related sulfurtransferase
MSTLETVGPQRAAELVRDGAVLVDIREPDEHARERIPGARHHPLSRLDGQTVAGSRDNILIFHCRSGARTQANSPRLAAVADCQAFVLEGGLDAWKKAGLPLAREHSQPIELMRQVQIAAGGIVLLGSILAYFVSSAFALLSGFVGAGLIFAGATGFCGMAKLLALMPWNRRGAPAADH